MSAQQSARMVHNIIQYVFGHELGGKHNIHLITSKSYNTNQYSCVDFVLANSTNADVDFR